MTECALCRLPIDGRAITADPASGAAFCCRGCLTVYTILAERGDVAAGRDLRETELFRRSLELGLVSTIAQPTPEGVPPDSRSVEEVFQLSGMWCGACAWLIADALERERGVLAAEVSFAADLLKIRYAPQYVPRDRILRRVRRLGYGVSEVDDREGTAPGDSDDLVLRLGVAAFLWANVMTFSLALYAGFFEQIPEPMRASIPFLLMALAAPAVFYSAWPVLRLAAAALRNGVARMETLLAIGILSAYGYSVVETLRRGPYVYFDTACALVTLVLAGKWIERSARSRAVASVAVLHRLLPRKARVIAGGSERYLAIDAVAPGDRVLVKTGERISVDGTIVEGEGGVDESLISGESAPIHKHVGDEVIAGSLNTGGPLIVRAARAGPASTVAQMVGSVERALASRSSLERAADRVSRVFVPAVLVIAIATFVAAIASGAPAGDGILRAIAVLVIACPCALGIATPLAVSAAIGAASRRGVLITDARVLETIRRLDVVVLDKTGTVTTGEFSLLNPPVEDLAALAAVESRSEHLLARAVVAAAAGLSLPEVTELDVVKGRGISGRAAGQPIVIGNRSMVGEIDAEQARIASAAEARGRTVAFYRIGQSRPKPLVFGDRLKPGATALVSALKAERLKVVLLSGDSRATTESIGVEIGADAVHAEALPDDKVRLIAELKAGGAVVAMIGDGVNDGPALASADLGIAMGSGTDLAIRASAMVLMHGDLDRVIDALDLAHRTLRAVRQNLFWAFAYNTIGIAVAAAGLLHPIVAAGGMIVSSVTVIANAARLGTIRRPTGATHERPSPLAPIAPARG